MVSEEDNDVPQSTTTNGHAKGVDECKVAIHDAIDDFADLLAAFTAENANDKEGMVNKSDVNWFAEELNWRFQSIRETFQTLDGALGKDSPPMRPQPNSASAPAPAYQRQPSSMDDIDGDDDDDDEVESVKVQQNQPSHPQQSGPPKPPQQNGNHPPDTTAPLNHTATENGNSLQVVSMQQEIDELNQQLLEKTTTVRSQQIELQLAQTTIQTLEGEVKRAKLAAKAPPPPPHQNGHLPHSARNESNDKLKKEIVALAQALEDSELQRAMALDQLQRERQNGERRMRKIMQAMEQSGMGSTNR